MCHSLILTSLCSSGLISEEDLRLHSLDAGFGSGGHGNAGRSQVEINKCHLTVTFLWHSFTHLCGQTNVHLFSIPLSVPQATGPALPISAETPPAVALPSTVKVCKHKNPLLYS